jgi:glycosyltransferase involved in cell wall biosynthesis
MRICFVSNSANRYGSEIALLELLQGLLKLNVECLVLLPEKGPLLVELDRLGIQWRIIKYPPWISGKKSTPHRLIRILKAIVMTVWVARKISQWHCDIVYTNTIWTGTGAFAAWLIGKHHIWHFHESEQYNFGLKFDLGLPVAMWLMSHLSKLIIVVSRSLQNDYARHIRRDKLRLVYQSVTIVDEIEKPNGLSPSGHIFQCVLVGSIHPLKRQKEAIAALFEVIRRGINAQLLVVGDGSKRFKAALRQQVEDYGLTQQVKFTGYLENPVSVMYKADVVLMCSRWEAFGRATVEAMLVGKPVIGTANSGGTAELIQDGITGLLYKAGDHNELANKIQFLYENPQEKLKLGAAARLWAAGRFTRERYAKETFTLLNEVLMTEKTSPPGPSN